MFASVVHLGSVFSDAQPVLLGARDLQVVDGPNGITAYVVATPTEGIWLSQWTVGNTGLSLTSSAQAVGTASVGEDPVVSHTTTSNGDAFAVLSGTSQIGLTGYDTDSLTLEGSFASGIDADLTHFVMHATGGTTYLYGIEDGSARPSVWALDATGQATLVDAGVTVTSPYHDSLLIAGGYLVAGSTGTRAITVYDIASDGTLIAHQEIERSDTPGISGTTHLATVEADGTRFVIIAGQDSSTLSVYAQNQNGRLFLRDHIIDSRNSRFDGVSSLDVQVIGDAIYVAAAGSDGGVSLFRMMPDGQLVQVATLVDELDTSLAGSVTLDLFSRADGDLGLLTMGSSESGISLFSVSETAAIVADSDGETQLAGSAGQDLFVMTADAARDQITGFDISEDMLDLTAWAFYRSPTQLVINPTATGAEIRFQSLIGEEVLVITSNDLQPIDPDLLTAALTTGPDRYMPWWLTGSRPDEVIPGQQLDGTTVNDTLQGGDGDDVILGRGGIDLIDGGAGADSIAGGEGSDRIMGGAGDDTVSGANGYDHIQGGTGNDLISGNNGNDSLFGDLGDDILFGGLGADLLEGGEANDDLSGDAGPDRLFGGSGADTLNGNAGADQLDGGLDHDVLLGGLNHDVLAGDWGDDTLDGGSGNDTLDGGEGNDSLEGGAGTDQLAGGNGADILSGGINHDQLSGGAGDDQLFGGNGDDSLIGDSGNDTLFGNSGDDRLEGGGGTDILNGGLGADTFVFRGGSVRIEDFQNDVDHLLIDPALWGGTALEPDEIAALAHVQDGTVVFDFGADGRLVIEGVGTTTALENDLGMA